MDSIAQIGDAGLPSDRDSQSTEEERLREIVDALPALISYIDNDQRYQFNNRACEVWLGLSRKEIRGKHVREIVGETNYTQIQPSIEKVLSGQTVDFETSISFEQSGPRTVSVQYLPHRVAGRVVGYSSWVQDISARKEIEQRAKKERDDLTALSRIGTQLAANLELEDLVQAATDATRELTGARFGAFFYNVVNAAGESYMLYTISGVPREAFSQFPMPRNTDVFEPTFSGAGPVRSGDITADSRYGHSDPYFGMPKGHLPVHSYLAVPVVSRSGEVLGGMFFGHPEVDVFDDRAEQIAAGIAVHAAVGIDNARLFRALSESEERLRQALQGERSARAESERLGHLKDEFLATLSHELRTPLNAILGWAQLLRVDLNNAETVARAVETIERNARVQTQMIEDLLDMSHIISGKIRLDVQRVDLADVVMAAVMSVQPAADAKRVRIEKVLDSLIGPVAGDPNRLQQIVWNLLTNAIKFTPSGGKVQVVLGRVNSHLEISVSDTGIGIQPEFLPHVFERFRQADASTTRQHRGLGLGLSIVKQLVELHGGRVQVKSLGDGQGSTFSVALPLSVVRDEGADRQHPRVATRRDAHDLEAPKLPGIKVLLVDDEPDARVLVQQVLEGAEAEVVAVPSAAEALRILEHQFRPDVILSDIGMPEIDGYQFIRLVRESASFDGKSIPAIALTAFARSEDRRRALLSGYQSHIAKPLEPAELITVLASVTHRV